MSGISNILPPHPDHPYQDCQTYRHSNKMQNTPEIWVKHLFQNEKIRIVTFLGIDSFKGQSLNKVASIESFLYHECIRHFGHKPLYNKRIP